MDVGSKDNGCDVKRYQNYIFDIISDDNSFYALKEGTGQVIGVALAKSMLASKEARINYKMSLETSFIKNVSFRIYNEIKFYSSNT